MTNWTDSTSAFPCPLVVSIYEKRWSYDSKGWDTPDSHRGQTNHRQLQPKFFSKYRLYAPGRGWCVSTDRCQVRPTHRKSVSWGVSGEIYPSPASSLHGDGTGCQSTPRFLFRLTKLFVHHWNEVLGGEQAPGLQVQTFRFSALLNMNKDFQFLFIFP